MATLEDVVALQVQLTRAQTRLTDCHGRVYPALSRRERRRLTRSIQAIRATLGWRPLDMAGR